MRPEEEGGGKEEGRGCREGGERTMDECRGKREGERREEGGRREGDMREEVGGGRFVVGRGVSYRVAISRGGVEYVLTGDDDRKGLNVALLALKGD